MRDYFFRLFEALEKTLQGEQRLLLNYQGEESDFIRFNHNRIRQPGSVIQHYVTIELVEGHRHQRSKLALSAEYPTDLSRLRGQLGSLQKTLPLLPEDPYLNLPESATHSEIIGENRLPESTTLLDTLQRHTQSSDVVGILANGGIYSGFADSLGSRHWHAGYSYNLNWSIHLENGRAVKNSDAGNQLDQQQLGEKILQDVHALEALQRNEVDPGAGAYRAYLCPAALKGLTSMLGWGDFGIRSQRTRQSALLPLIDGQRQWSEKLGVSEQRGDGQTPAFTASGFYCDQTVSLIEKGMYKGALINERSAQEYGLQVNAGQESPQSLHMQAGDIPLESVLKELDTGLYLTNLWYCNYSDRTWARITGMTRYACLWVERGKIIGPLASMRFDVSLHDIFGEGLIGLTAERERLSDSSTYHQRSQDSSLLPGMLVEGFPLTL